MMKIDIISPNKQQLVIRQRLIRLLGLILVTGSLLFFAHLMMQYQIVCNEKQYNQAKDCVLKNKFYNFYQNTTPLGELKHAVVVTSTSRKANTLYSLYLNTSKENINLSGDSSSGRNNKDSVASAINNYIQTSLEKSFDIPYPTNWVLLLSNILILLIGLGLLYFKDSIILFDKNSQTVTIKRQGLLGKGTHVSFPLAEIDRIIIETTQDSSNSPLYRLALAFKDKHKPTIPFIDSYNSLYENKVILANRLNEFINVQAKKP